MLSRRFEISASSLQSQTTSTTRKDLKIFHIENLMADFEGATILDFYFFDLNQETSRGITQLFCALIRAILL